MTVLGGMQERRSYTMTALLAGAGIEEDSCTVATAHHYGREGCGYTMIELLTGIEGDSCKTALLAGREGQSYTMTALLAGVEGDSCTTAKHAGREECGYTTVRHCSRRGDWSQRDGCYAGSHGDGDSDGLLDGTMLGARLGLLLGMRLGRSVELSLDISDGNVLGSDESIAVGVATTGGASVVGTAESWTETQTDCWTEQCSVPGWYCCSACGWEDPFELSINVYLRR
jgi:hypothetical protein